MQKVMELSKQNAFGIKPQAIDAQTKKLLPTLELQIVPGDGNCFYRALAQKIYGNHNRYKEIKNKIIDYLREQDNDAQFIDFVVPTLPDNFHFKSSETAKEGCLRYYKGNGIYADDIITSNAGKALGVNICIFRDNAVNLSLVSRELDIIQQHKTHCIYYHNQGENDNLAHYDALQDKSSRLNLIAQNIVNKYLKQDVVTRDQLNEEIRLVNDEYNISQELASVYQVNSEINYREVLKPLIENVKSLTSQKIDEEIANIIAEDQILWDQIELVTSGSFLDLNSDF